MSSIKKSCHECAMPLSMGVANCPNCGATVGTLFTPGSPPAVAAKGGRHRSLNVHIDYHDRVNKAKERANNSLILALASFFPLVGFLMGIAAIALSLMASRTLKADNIEDGRGLATAGLIIGVLGLVAQGGYVVYVIRSGSPFG